VAAALIFLCDFSAWEHNGGPIQYPGRLVMDSRRCTLAAIVLAAGALVAAPAWAQKEEPEPKPASGAIHVLGLEGIARNAKGDLNVADGSLRFTRKGTGKDVTHFELPLAQVEDVFTSDDSQRVIRGTLQVLSMAAPYGGGRFLSLFRTKIDLLTIQYRDAAGARHGVIFTLPDGKAAPMKQQMVAGGAHASVPAEPQGEKKEEKKP